MTLALVALLLPCVLGTDEYFYYGGDITNDHGPIACGLNLSWEDARTYDDFDLPLGKLRLRAEGSAGTHNGMRSIVDSLATDSFPRLRVGIGAAGTDAARHVLEPFTVEEEATIRVAVEEAADAILAWLASGDLEACMTRFHSRWNQGDAGTRVPVDPYP